MNSVVLLFAVLLTFASWVDAAITFPNADEKCTQETYNGPSGTIDYPGDGKNYSNSLNCLFKIIVAKDHFVQFYFSRFDFELVTLEVTPFVPDGCYDWLKFIDGLDEIDNTTTFCNNGPDPLNKMFSSKNSQITFWMFSDSNNSGKGFKLDWKAVEVSKPEPPCECNDIGTESEDCKKVTEKCTCKTGYKGAECDQCTEGYWNSSTSTGECKKCNCNNCFDNQIATCKKSNGECECSCKAGYDEPKCEECKENYWMSSSECKECESCEGICEKNQTGSCDKNGECECSCKAGYVEPKCEECKKDYWMLSSECKKCAVCNNCPEPNKIGKCNKSNGECKCSSAATFTFDKTIVLFTAFLIILSHQF